MTRTAFLHIYYHQGHENLKVLDSEERAFVYIIDRSSSQPNLTISRASDTGEREKIAGTISIPDSPSNIQLHFPDREVKMIEENPKAGYHSVVGSNINWKWESDSGEDLRVHDLTAGELLGRFEIASLSTHKKGTIFVARDMPMEDLDVLMVTALARNEYDRRVQKEGLHDLEKGAQIGWNIGQILSNI